MESVYHFSDKQKRYSGKVRDVYTIDDHIIIIASDRISAFDHILPKLIPYKGQVLNQIAAYFLYACSDLVPHWLEHTPHPAVSVGKRCDPVPIEMVIRGYLAGHAAREYKSGKRILCGVSLPDGLKEGDKLPHPIITPSTKAAEGHDEDISREEILAQGIISETQYHRMEEYTRALFQRGTEMAASRNLILVDTKYEFGIYHGDILLMDEIHTPDSSRYYIADGYEERQREGVPQKQLSKEFVREWLISKGFQGKEGQVMPEMPDYFIEEISNRYIELFERITGQAFSPSDEPLDLEWIQNYLQKE